MKSEQPGEDEEIADGGEAGGENVPEVVEVPDAIETVEEIEQDTAPLFDQDLETPALVLELEYQKPASAKADEDADSLELGGVAEARGVLEAYLFASNEPLSVQRLSKLMNNLHPRSVRGLLLELQMEYDSRPGALQILEIAGGFQMSTRPHLAEWMFRMHKHRKRTALSPATLETLAIIAYKQPITKGEVEAIRGVESSGTTRTLQDLNLIEASGRREVVGRPQLFATTDQFLKVFGLKSLADLPSIAELRSHFSEEQKIVRKVAQAPVVEDIETDVADNSETEAIDEANTD